MKKQENLKVQWDAMEFAAGSVFTKCIPISSMYDDERSLPAVDESSETLSSAQSDDLLDILINARLTPSNEELLRLADAYPPAQSWYEEEELPF